MGSLAATPRVGLFLGMGPIAGAQFYKHFEEAFSGKPDHEHPIVYCYSDPTMPRKDAGVAGTGPSPVEGLHCGLEFFMSVGVQLILAPCNTVMFYRPALLEHFDVPFLDIVEVVAEHLVASFGVATKVALMATTATIESGLYQRALSRHLPRASLIVPDSGYQETVAELIEEIKLGVHIHSDLPQARTLSVLDHLRTQGSEVVVAGCTEISCVLSRADYSPPVVDSSRILAEAGARQVSRLVASDARPRSSGNYSP